MFKIDFLLYIIICKTNINYVLLEALNKIAKNKTEISKYSNR